MGKSGRELGKIAVEKLKLLIKECDEDGKFLPLHKSGDALHLSNICKELGVVRTTVNTNTVFRRILEEYAKRQDVKYSHKGQVAPEEEVHADSSPDVMVSAKRLRDAQMRLALAERQNAELRAANASLRAKIMLNDEVVELIALGGRINPGSA